MFLYHMVLVVFSSVSSGLSALAANTWEDILKFKLGHIDEFKAAILTKVLGKYIMFFTLMLLNHLFLLFCHLKLELLTQFPASNDEKMLLLMEDRHPSNCINE